MKIFYGAGLNENQFPHPSEAASLSFNFDLQKDSNYLTPRRAFDLKGTTPVQEDVRGLMQLVKRDNTSTTLVQSGDTVYSWTGFDTSTSFTEEVVIDSETSQLRDCYWSLDDYIVITDLQKQIPVMKWDGSTFDTHVTGLGGELRAKYGAVHQNRLWLANITESGTSIPHMVLASTFDSATSFDTTQRAVEGTFTTGLEAFYMLTPDLKPINGLLVMHTDLIISTVDGKLYRLSGDSPSNYKWTDFYPRSSAIGDESIVNAGNDVFYMRTGGNIESVQATQNYGDVGADDISRWIPNTVFNQTGCIAIYDQTFQKVLFFLTGAGSEAPEGPAESSEEPEFVDMREARSVFAASTGGPGKVLVLYKDILYGGAVVDESGQKAKLSPWSVYRTSHYSNLQVSAAKYMRRPGTTDYTVYFGGPQGQIFDLNGTGTHGDAASDDISVTRRIRFLGKEQGIDYTRNIPRGVVQYVRLGECDFNIEMEFSGEYNTSNAAVHLKGSGGLGASFWGGEAYFGGAFYWGAADKADFFLSHQKFDNVGRGRVVTCVFSTTTSVKYQVNHVELPG